MEREYIDWTKEVPTEPPKELIPWMVKRGFFKKEFIIYSMADVKNPYGGKDRMVECRCSHCGGVFYAEKAESGCHNGGGYGFWHPETNEIIGAYKETVCPMCGYEVETRHISRYGDYDAGVEYPMMVLKIKGKICLASWRIQKKIDKYGIAKFDTDPHEAYIFEGKKCTKIQGYTKFMLVYYNRDWEVRQNCRDTFGMKSIIMAFDKRIFNGTELENSKFDIYTRRQGCYPVTYLRLYQKHRNVENLVTSGASYLIDEKIKAASSGYYYAASRIKTTIEGVNWKAVKPHEMLGLSKEEFYRFIIDKVSDEWISIYARAKERGVILSDGDLALCKRFFTKYDMNNIFECKEVPFHKILPKAVRYLRKQRDKYPKDNNSLHELMDYWRMAKELGYELKADDEIYPQRLKNSHDAVSDALTARKNAAKNEKIRERFDALKRFSFCKGDYLIFPTPSADALMKEGKELCHCVATYTDKVSRGDTAIFFIRERKCPKVPFFTLELDEKEGRVRQNRGKHNCGKTEAVQAFEDAFIENVKKILMKESKRRKTA